MSQIQIVTDSTADIPEHITKELGITVIPLKVTFDQKKPIVTEKIYLLNSFMRSCRSMNQCRPLLSRHLMSLKPYLNV
ncbi:DegV family protein [Thalassobacillus sp. C254]|uniref:DegV family protein n=1 Tax=Thalassobacillus sp. C254 TaxID=1225341 RepID=UPI00277D076D|nr:DegV family protein [Thalassobacillus sp. C254]